METNVTLEQLAQELEQVKRELREVKEQYATTQNENVTGTIMQQPQEVTVGGKTRIEYPTDHPHIYTSPEMHRGEPTIRGSSITVRAIVECVRIGQTPLEMQETFPHLNLAKIYDALSYYYDHTAEIEGYLRENEEAMWRLTHRAST